MIDDTFARQSLAPHAVASFDALVAAGAANALSLVPLMRSGRLVYAIGVYMPVYDGAGHEFEPLAYVLSPEASAGLTCAAAADLKR